MADILKKVLQLAKEAKLFITYNESGSVQWLGDGRAFYQLCEQENLTPQFLTAAAKLTETDVGVTAFQTIDLKKEFFIADNDETEAPCDSGDFNIVLSGKEYKIFNSPQFGARMIPKKYLDMFAEGYSVYIRECSHGEFFAIKEGMLLRAVIDNDWQILLNTIYAQDIKNFADNVQKAVDLAKESGQVIMEGEEDGD